MYIYSEIDAWQHVETKNILDTQRYCIGHSSGFHLFLSVLSIFTILFNKMFLFSSDVYTNDNFYATGTNHSSRRL
jgi:hypothetical protein